MENHTKDNKINFEKIFSSCEEYVHPSTVLFRAIEFKLLKEKQAKIFKITNALDLGCGDGIAGKTLFEKPIKYGLEINPTSVIQAQKTGIYKQTLLTNGKEIPIKNKSLDLVYSNCTIEHIKPIKEVFGEVSRVLKENGLFAFTTLTDKFAEHSTFSHLNLKLVAKIYGFLRNKKLQHYNCYSYKNWTKLLNKSGFKIIDCYLYLNKNEIEYWDKLFLCNNFFRILNRINKKLFLFVYQNFFRKKIYYTYQKSAADKINGVAIFILAKKDSK